MKKLLACIIILMPLQGLASQAETDSFFESRRHMSPLHFLAVKGDAALMAGALAILNGSVDQRDSHGLTPLFYAIRLGHTEIVDLLIRHGAQAKNLVTQGNVTPLHSIMHGCSNASLVHKVLRWHSRSGCSFLDINAQDKDGDTPLHIAMYFDKPDAALALLDYNPNIYVINKSNSTALYYACKKNYVDVALKIALLWSRTTKKTTPLHIAARANNASIIKELVLKQQWSLETRNKEGTPLYTALLHANCEAAEALIECGAHIDKLKNSIGANPLHVSIITGDVEDVEKLLDWLASKNKPVLDVNESYHGMTPRQLAVRFLRGDKQRQMIALLENVGQRQNQSTAPPEHPPAPARASQHETGPKTALHFAASVRSPELARTLLTTHPALINAKDEKGITPLFVALGIGNTENAQLLIEHGACIENVREPKHQMSPLHSLVAKTSDAVDLRRVLDWQEQHNYQILDINAKTDNDATPLILALFRDEDEIRTRIVDVLLEKNADIYCKDNSGLDALRYALEKGYIEIAMKIARRWTRNRIGQTVLHTAAAAANIPALIRIIEELRPDLDARDEDGDSPLFEALRRGHTDVADVLLRYGARSDTCINNNGFSPLHLALVMQKAEDVKKLLTWQQQKDDRILDVNKRDPNGRLPLEMARNLLDGEDRAQVIDLLISLGAGGIVLEDRDAESGSRQSTTLRTLLLLLSLRQARARQQQGTREASQTGLHQILEAILDDSLRQQIPETTELDDILDRCLE